MINVNLPGADFKKLGSRGGSLLISRGGRFRDDNTSLLRAGTGDEPKNTQNNT